MRNFLGNDFDLAQERYRLPETTRKFLYQAFKARIPKHAFHHYHVTLQRLKQGNVKALFLNVADYDLLSSIKIINAAYEKGANLLCERI